MIQDFVKYEFRDKEGEIREASQALQDSGVALTPNIPAKSTSTCRSNLRGLGILNGKSMDADPRKLQKARLARDLGGHLFPR